MLEYSQAANNTTYFEYSSNGYRYFKKKNSSYPEYYIYDPNGRLHAIATTVTLLMEDGTTLLVMFPITQYIWGPDRVLAKIDKTTNTSYYYLYNGHGDVVQIIDTSGAIKNTYDYDVWGNFLKKEETIENHFTYFGQTYDEETGLYYLRARYYDPTTGRFTQQDPAEDGYNWYVYGNQNPIKYVDPSGESLVLTIAGVTISVKTALELLGASALVVVASKAYIERFKAAIALGKTVYDSILYAKGGKQNIPLNLCMKPAQVITTGGNLLNMRSLQIVKSHSRLLLV